MNIKFWRKIIFLSLERKILIKLKQALLIRLKISKRMNLNKKQTYYLCRRQYFYTNNIIEYEKLNPKTQNLAKLTKVIVVLVDLTIDKILLNK